MRKQKKHISDNDTFINLIQIANEDESVRKTLLSILKLDSFNRKSFLNTYIEQMRLKNAPQDFIEAISSLLNDDIAQKVIEIIS